MTASNIKFSKNLFVVILISICCLVPICTAFLIYKYSVNILSIDDLFLANYFNSLIKVDIRDIVKNLLLPINGHVFLVPKLILAPLAFLNIWDTKILILIGWLFACLSTLFITFIFAKTSSLYSKSPNIYLVIAASLITNLIYFSPSSSENWMVSIQISQFLSIFCFIAILATLTFVRGYKSILISSLLGLISSFSYGFGFISYISAYPIILYFGLRSYDIDIVDLKNYLDTLKKAIFSKHSFFWITSASIVLFLYLAIITTSSQGASNPELSLPIAREKVLKDIPKTIAFLLQIIGAPLGLGFYKPYQFSLIWGSVLILSFIALFIWLLLNRKKIHLFSYLPWISLGTFSIMVNCLTAISRSYIVPDQSLNPRYISSSNLLVISIILIFLQASQGNLKNIYRSFNHKLIFGGLSILMFVFASYSYMLTWNSGLVLMQYISGLRLQSQACITYVDECPDQFIQRTLSIALFRADYPIAKKMGMFKSSNIFEESTNVTYGHVDGIDRSPAKLDNFEIWGWAIPPNDEWTATLVITKETSKKIVGLASANDLSPDLSEYKKDKRYSQVRWRAFIPEDLLDDGQNILTAWMFDNTHNKLIQFGETKTVFKQPASKRTN